MIEWPRENEKLFVSAADWQNNACVMRQSYISIANCYKESADALIVSALEANIYIDCAVYPVVFLYRQFIELALKDIVWSLRRFGGKAKPPKGHDLKVLWEDVKRLSREHYGSEYPKEFDYLDGCITELHTHDPRSDAFRYPYDNDWKPTLPDLRHINLRHLFETMERVSNFLGGLSTDLSERLYAGQE